MSSTQAMFQSHAATGSGSPNQSPSARNGGYKALRGEAGGEKSAGRGGSEGREGGRNIDIHFERRSCRSFMKKTPFFTPQRHRKNKINISRLLKSSFHSRPLGGKKSSFRSFFEAAACH